MRRHRWERMAGPVIAIAVICSSVVACSSSDGSMRQRSDDTAAMPSSSSRAQPPITGTAYYLRADGDDSADGRSPSTAWRTLARATEQVLRPGDGVLLRSGDRFSGTLIIDAADAGDEQSPVVVRSTGPGRSAIESATGAAIYVHNTAGVDIAGLELFGGEPFSPVDGIAVFNDLDAGGRLPGVAISDVDISGFGNGISIGGTRVENGFSNVTIAAASVHDNKLNGIIIYGPSLTPGGQGYANADVSIEGVEVFGNDGDPDEMGANTGSGIMIGSTLRASVTGSTAHDNGALCNAGLGPNGIWAYDSTQVRFERNVAYNNHTGTGTADGNGFDFDVNVSDSVMQYNLSYGNDGAGFFIYTYRLDGSQSGNIVRYNVSSNDVRRREFYAGLMVAAAPDAAAPDSHMGIRNTQIYHNTVIMTAQREGAPAALRMYGPLDQVLIANNIFVVRGGSPAVDSDAQSTDRVLLAGNAYYDPDGPVTFRWAGTSYVGVDSWRSATGQETLNGAPTGSEGNLRLPGAFEPISVVAADELPGASALIPGPGSPALSGGVDLAALSFDRGSATYFGPGHPCSGPGAGASC